jgi:hypothetical protein
MAPIMTALIDDTFFMQGVESYHRGDFLDDCPFEGSEAVRWRKGWWEGNKSGMFRHEDFSLVKNVSSFVRFDFDYDG